MRPAFAYYGGKGRLAPWVAKVLPPHSVYVEPFAGSAAVLLAKRPVRHEVLNDVDAQLINFYRVLRERPEALELAVRLTPYARDEWAGADLDDVDVDLLDPLEQARRWWCRSTQAFGQSATTSTGWSISTAQTSPRMYQLTNRLDRFALVAERLRHVFIENRNALDLIRRFGADPKACIYEDPPYFKGTRTALNCYRHEFQTEDQHRALAAVNHEAKAAVVVSGYPSDLYDLDLYAGWHRIERQVVRRAGNGRTHGLGDATEVFWSNRPLGNVDHPQLDLGGAA